MTVLFIFRDITKIWSKLRETTKFLIEKVQCVPNVKRLSNFLKIEELDVFTKNNLSAFAHEIYKIFKIYLQITWNLVNIF